MIMRFSAITALLLVISFFLLGCIKPNGSNGTTGVPKDRPIDPSLIVCDENPEIIDDDLTTSSRIAYPSDIKTPLHPFTIIKFRKPVYVTFIEVYTKDDLKNLTISFANVNDTESKAIPWNGLRSSVNVEKEQNKRITIRNKLNMMKLMANWLDTRQRKQTGRDNIIIVEGPEVYEIKFYTNQANGGK